MAQESQDLARQIDALVEAIPLIHRDYQAMLVGFAIDELVLRSPVYTGAYRAAHAVGVGLPGGPPSRLVYDSPEHPTSGVDLEVGDEPEPPNGNEAQEAYEHEEPFQCAILYNDRHYADQVEYGWPSRAGYAVYGIVEALVAHFAEVLALRQDEPRLRR